MTYSLNNFETGEKYTLQIEGLEYSLELPWVILEGTPKLKIVSLNLLGQTKLNQDLGILLAKKIKKDFPKLQNIAFLTPVEKSLQLAQVVANELNLSALAIAYNRIKPHMEPKTRPVIQLGSSSITSGEKFLALYERDLNFLKKHQQIILLDDVISTGSTLFALKELIEEVNNFFKLSPKLSIIASYFVAKEGNTKFNFDFPIHYLTTLPAPQIL